MRPSSFVVVLIATALFRLGQPSQDPRLFAPTYYIAADADFKGVPNEMRVRGASNLPSGTRLSVDVYDSIGPGSTRLNQDAVAVINKDGFFEVLLRPKPSMEFRHKLVCEVLLMPTFPNQESGVLQVIGKRGEHLGFPNNPQARVVSEGYYLSERIYVP